MTTSNNELIQSPKTMNWGFLQWIPTLAIAVLSAGMFTFVSYRTGFKYGMDFPAHLRWAQTLAEQGVILLPHFTYEQLVVIFRALLPIGYTELIHSGLSTWLAARSYKIAGLLVIAIFYAMTAVVLQRRFLTAFQSIGSKISGGLSFLCTLVLMLVAPLNLLTVGEHRLYLGYIGINVYHNPTVIMLKPMALVLFWLLLEKVAGGAKLANIIGMAALTVYSTFTKPNFTICLLPVLFLWMLYRWWKKQPVQVSTAVMGFILPAILVLGCQYWFGYLDPGNSRIIFAPLVVMKFFAPSGLGWMFLLSFLFPLVVLILQFRKGVQDQGLLLAWGVFLVGAGMTYLLAEEGAREYHLNFAWGAQVGLFILFIQSALFLIKNWKLKETNGSQSIPTWQKIPIGIILGLHLVGGIIWYLAEVFQPSQWWW